MKKTQLLPPSTWTPNLLIKRYFSVSPPIYPHPYLGTSLLSKVGWMWVTCTRTNGDLYPRKWNPVTKYLLWSHDQHKEAKGGPWNPCPTDALWTEDSFRVQFQLEALLTIKQHDITQPEEGWDQRNRNLLLLQSAYGNLCGCYLWLQCGWFGKGTFTKWWLPFLNEH